jgi:glycine/D-amino acid oxidase-like deaminating enzyme
MGPANSRASSGGESRMTRSIYGRDLVYARMALASLAEWRALSDTASLPLFHPIGFLFLFGRMEDYARSSIEARRELGLPLQTLDRAGLAHRWPQIAFDGVEFGFYESEFGALMARRSVGELVRRFAARDGEYRHGHAVPDPQDGHVVTINGEAHRAGAIVYACGPWLPKMFPDILGERIFVTRQEIAFMAPPNGDARFEAHALPGWADFNGGDMYYGFPNLEGRGFKIAHDTHGAPFDPDAGDRSMSAAGAALVRAFAARRFPALADRPFTEFRVCQYENSSNGDFLIDRHPTLNGAFLLGAGSGHGFKHGPEVGRLMADLVLGRAAAPDPRFALASKANVQRREVL